ncbi:MAG: FliG C-terminal domain-containing protein [Planctomycetota bacterium]
MNVTGTWSSRLKQRLAASGYSVRLGAGALVVFALVGAAWLAANPGQPDLLRLDEPSATPEQIIYLRTQLDRRGIAHESRKGQLYVSREHVSLARELLQGQPAAPPELTQPFERIAGESSLWTSRSRQTQRWQAAKMRALSRLIQMFPSVQSATVLYEPGEPAGLGRNETAPTAAVKIALAEDAAVDDALVAAIADQVAGTIRGMRRENVRIIDNVGCSYRVGESGESSGSSGASLALLERAERFYRRQIRQALAYIPNLAVAVRVDVDEQTPRCTGASVSIPRSSLPTLCRAGEDPNETELLAAFDSRREQLAATLARLLDTDTSHAVQVNWYPDGSAQPAASAAPQQPQPSEQAASTLPWEGVIAAAAGGVGLLATAVWTGVKLGRRRAPAASVSAEDETPGQDRTGLAQEQPADELAFLRTLPRRAAGELLAPEHPQTVALVLSQLSSLEAGQILSELDEDVQRDVASRMGGLDAVDTDLLTEVAGELRRRLEIQAPAMVPASQPDLPADDVADEFDELCQLPSAVLGRALRECDAVELAAALQSAGEETKGAVLSALPFPRSGDVSEQMEQIGPLGVERIERARRQVMDAVQRELAGRYEPASAG